MYIIDISVAILSYDLVANVGMERYIPRLHGVAR